MRPVCGVALLAYAFVVTAQLPATAEAREGTQCFDDWSLAAQIVKQEQLATVEELAGAAKGKLGGAIVRTSLCHEDGRYVYRLVVRDRQGQFRWKRVDARNPF